MGVPIKIRALLLLIWTIAGAKLVAQNSNTLTISGTVSDPSGAILPRAHIDVRNTATGLVISSTTDAQGRYTISGLAPGTYDVTCAADGFQADVRKGITVNAERELQMNFVLNIGAVTETVSVEEITPPKADHLVWNAWEEEYSSSVKPSFTPTQKLLTGKQYALVLDLSAIIYGVETGEFGHSTGASFDNWINSNADSQATVKVLVIPDERFFQPQADDQRVKSFDIDLKKLRRTERKGFKLKGAAFQYLRTHKDSPFTFGRQLFEIETKKVPGSAAIALSIWAEGRPVDELSVPVCIVASINERCSGVAPANFSLDGVDPISRGEVPDAALHLIELDSTSLVGVLRCNTCQGWKPDEYRTWKLGRSAAWLSDMLTKTLITGFQQAAAAADDNAFQNVGSALFHAVFQNDEGNGQPSSAEQGFMDFVSATLRKEGQSLTPPSIFIRMLPNNSDPLFLFPLGMMSLPTSASSNAFLGFHFRVETPLELQDYTSSPSCISKWVLLVPPPTGLSKDNPLAFARDKFLDWIQAFGGWGDHAQVDDDLNTFGKWLGDNTKDSDSEALLIISHHDTNKLVFDSDTEVPAIFSSNIQRSFRTPSLAIIDACGTADPGAFDFVRELNREGINSIIATDTEIDARMAGLFASTLMSLLQSHANDPKYTLDIAKLDAVNALSSLRDKDDKPYGARALIFSLVGNGNITLCTPPNTSANR